MTMRIHILKKISSHVWKSTLRNRSARWLVGIVNIVLLFALVLEYQTLISHQALAHEYSQQVRERWENSPDKHPHRMAHYGYIAFRQKFPLSFFDAGLERYMGNAVFLEAHKQNTVNFSEASLSNGIVRFGELSAGSVLQLLLPLLLIFWGFKAITRERENGTLRMLLAQGVHWPELIAGKALGIMLISFLLVVPATAISLFLLAIDEMTTHHPQAIVRLALLMSGYMIYAMIIALLAVWWSAKSKNSTTSLITLICCWVVWVLVMPKLSQVAGQAFYPSSSKAEFEAKVEEEIVQHGDSHNPNDPHYASLRDSLLRVHGVDATDQLPFNYNGYVMREGERLSSEIYRRHKRDLTAIYQRQQSVIRLAALGNPFLAMRLVSMALTGTDYKSYDDFQQQVEAYRFELAQTMNELQIRHVGNDVRSSADARGFISRQHWVDFPDFEHSFGTIAETLRQEWLPWLSLLLWCGGLLFAAWYGSYHSKVKS